MAEGDSMHDVVCWGQANNDQLGLQFDKLRAKQK
jgi:hypothetical protein